jgi:glycosyltransferase involved in cell wall biosynthesis
MFNLPISIIIPAYNEENAIADTVNEIVNICNQSKINDYEIIVVNDGSTDQTTSKLTKMNVKILKRWG